MIGDQDDMRLRIRSVLPTQWFPDSAPILDGLLSALSWSWSWSWSVLAYVKAQTRIVTASDVWLDVIAFDYFGGRVARQSNETDDGLRARIQTELNRERGTRAAIISAVLDLTGDAPLVFEPARTTDTGGWGGSASQVNGLAYGAAGGWGSLMLPFQFFVTAYRPSGSGAPNVAGWGSPAGGYGRGAIEYASEASISGGVTDAAIYAVIADVLPVATIAWTQITN